MNAFNKFFLAIILAPRKLYRAWGIDVPHLTAILTTKLVMDDRRPNTMQMTRQHQNKEKEISNATLGTMFMSALMGALFLFSFSVGNEFVTQLTIYYSMFLTVLCMMLVSDFTSVLIDVRDNYIILPKPVNDRTFVVARLLHIFIHIVKIMVPMSLPGMLFIGFKAGLAAGIIFLAICFFATLLAIFLINAAYILILRVTTPERFKTIISYFQIAFAILIYGSSQILPRMMRDMDRESISLADQSWLIALPPYWFAGAFNTLWSWQCTPQQGLAAAMAVAVPILSIYVVVKYLAPVFNQKLAMISGAEGAPAPTAKTGGKPEKNGFAEKIAGMFTSSKAEQTGFLFTWKMMARSRDFKIKVYPSIGYFVVLLFVLFLQNNNPGGEMAATFMPLIAIYLSSMILTVAVSQAAYSEKFKAAWMFFITPLQRPGAVISGALKATIFQFYVIGALLIILIGTWLAGPGMLPNILLGLCNQLVIIYVIASVGAKKLPFSLPLAEVQKGGQFLRSMFMLLASGLIGLIHFFLFKSLLGIGIAFMVSIGILWLLMRNMRQVTWKKLQMNDDGF